MAETLYNWVNAVFGIGLAEEIGDTVEALLNAMESVLTNAFISQIMTLMSGIACSLLVIYFFQSMMDQASRDMFSFEKLIVGFIKMLVAFCVLLYLKEMLGFLVTLARGFTGMATHLLSFHDEDAIFNPGTSTLEAYKKYFGIRHIVAALGCFLSLMLPYLLCMVAELMAKLIIASTVIRLIARATFSPIAVVQMFEDGTKSSGMRYLKGLFAEAMTFGVILIIVGVANKVSGAWVAGTIHIDAGALNDPETLIECLSFSTILPMIIPKLAIAGSMASASKIAHDVLGA